MNKTEAIKYISGELEILPAVVAREFAEKIVEGLERQGVKFAPSN